MVIVQVPQHHQEVTAFKLKAKQVEVRHVLPMILLLQVVIRQVKIQRRILLQMVELSLQKLRVMVDNLLILIPLKQQMIIQRDLQMELRTHLDKHRRRLMMLKGRD